MDIIITEKAKKYLNKKNCKTIVLDMTVIGGNACWSGYRAETQYLPSVRMGLENENIPAGFSQIDKEDFHILLSFRFKSVEDKKVIVDSKKVLFYENLKITLE